MEYTAKTLMSAKIIKCVHMPARMLLAHIFVNALKDSNAHRPLMMLLTHAKISTNALRSLNVVLLECVSILKVVLCVIVMQVTNPAKTV